MIRVEVGSIEELCVTVERDATLLTANDLKYIDGLSSPKRRREVIAWRALLRKVLREMTGHTYIYKGDVERAEVTYSPVGAPLLTGVEGLHIGVSHSSRHIALAVADEPCGIDIEDCGRDFERVSNRFTTHEEREAVRLHKVLDNSNNPTNSAEKYILPIIWSAKEALYKVSGQEGLNLVEDIKIFFDGELYGEVGGVIYNVHHRTHEECIIAYTQEERCLEV